MKCFPRVITIVALAVFSVACSGGGEPVAAEATPVPTPVIGGIPAGDEPVAGSTAAPDAADPTPSVGPTPSPLPLVENDVLRAAVDAYEVDPQPDGTAAFDVLERSVRADGLVELTVCTWDGRGVFDEVRQVLVEVDGESSTTLEATVLSTAPTAGGCLNGELMESVVEFADGFLAEFAEALAEPATFGTRGFERLVSAESFAATSALFERDVADGVTNIAPYRGRSVPQDLLAPLAWRRYTDDRAGPVFEVVFCLEMHPESGLYRDGVLISGGPQPDRTGDHLIGLLQLVRDGDARSWQMRVEESLVWGDCFRSGAWLDAVNAWRPQPRVWQEWR